MATAIARHGKMACLPKRWPAYRSDSGCPVSPIHLKSVSNTQHEEHTRSDDDDEENTSIQEI